jgi:amino acid transporter
MSPTRIALKRTLVGRRMPLSQLEGELLPKRLALPIFASDPLSSVAYATEAGLLVLITASLASRALIVPISVVITALLAIVVLSYRQTIYAYPNGGGSYVVAKENLGAVAGLVAAASLLTDYVLTAAVSIASGVLAVTSAVPELASHAVAVSLAVLVLLVLVNLRGVRESGYAFAFPTYAFIGSVGALVAIGFARGLISGWPTAHVPDAAPVGLAGSVGIIVLLRAFASGCSALTGVEAISNGVPAFRRPQATNASRTLMVMGGIAILLFMGVSLLAWKTDARPSGTVSVLSEIARAVFPPGDTSFGYYLVQASTAAVLALAANTAFQGFPRLAALLASDSYLPRQFANLGDRLVFSNGIVVLAVVAGALIVGFNADVNSLIHLYLLGVFTAFTLSQFGMVRRSFTLRGTPNCPGWGAVALNGTGGLLTGLVGVIVLVTKFTEGAWMVTIAIPVLVLGFALINRHYGDVNSRLRVPPNTPLPRVAAGGPVVLYVDELDDATAEAVRFVRSVAGDRFQAVHVSEASGISGAWRAFSGTSAPLVVLPPSGTVSGTVAAWVREVERGPDEITTIVVPELFPSRTLHAVFRGRTALALRLRLQGERDIVVTDVPVVARPPGALEPKELGGRKTTVLLPIASDDAASRRAIVYALGLGASDVRGLHIALGDDDADKARAAWAARAMPIPVDVVASPYRDLGGPLLAAIRAVTADPDAVCVVVLPEIISPHRWQRVLHNQRGRFIKRLLLFEDRVILASVPYRVPTGPLAAPSEPGAALGALPRGASPALEQASAPPARRRAARADPVLRPAGPHEPRLSTEAMWRLFEGISGSLALLAVTFLVLLVLRSRLSVEAVALVLLLPPLAAAMAGRVLAVAMAALGAVTLNYFFIKPYYSFTIDTTQGITAFLVYTAVALTVAVVAGQLRETRATAEVRIAQERTVQDVAVDLLRGGDPATVLASRLQAFADALGVSAAVRVDGAPPILTYGATAELLAVELPSARYHAVELPRGGRIVVDAGRRITREQQQVVNALGRVVSAGETHDAPVT